MGVTDTTPTRNVSVSNTTRFSVIDKPMVREAAMATMVRMSCRRRTRSPRGDIRRRPTAYLRKISSVFYLGLLDVPGLHESGDSASTTSVDDPCRWAFETNLET